MSAILMAKEYWMDSQFSAARFYGEIKINGITYAVCDKRGATLFELSMTRSPWYDPNAKQAIPPGEPADLVQIKWVPVYKALGREKLLAVIRQGMTLEQAEEYAGIAPKKKTPKKPPKKTTKT